LSSDEAKFRLAPGTGVRLKPGANEHPDPFLIGEPSLLIVGATGVVHQSFGWLHEIHGEGWVADIATEYLEVLDGDGNS
jgi:hypothetical protein